MQEFKLIGDKLRTLRTEKDASLEEVAKATGVTRSLLSKYERGQVEPGLRSLSSLVRYYDVSLDWLFGFTEDRHPINTDNPLTDLSDVQKVKAISYIDFLKSEE